MTLSSTYQQNHKFKKKKKTISNARDQTIRRRTLMMEKTHHVFPEALSKMFADLVCSP